MEGYTAVSERYRVNLASDYGGSEPVICQVSLDGLVLMTPSTQSTLKKYPLNHISRWALRGSSLVLYTRTPVDVEERTLTLAGDDRVIRSVLDTLTCCCMQMVELLESQSSNANAPSTDNDHAVAEQLQAMINSGSNGRTTVTADQVEFWNGASKSGWLYSQGEVIKTWRRRWFVLKQGFLFRFADANVDHSSKPRGIVDLTIVQDVKDGREATGKPNSLKLSTANGQVCYLCDSETEQVEWLSALEGEVAKIVRAAAGMVDDGLAAAAAAAAAKAKPAARAADEKQHNTEWARRLEAGFDSAQRSRRESGRSGGGGADGGGNFDRNGNPMVKVVGFDSAGQEYDYAPAQPSHHGREYGGGGYSSIAGYGNVAGAKQAPEREPLVSVSYGAQPSAESDTSAYGGGGYGGPEHYSAYSPAAQPQSQPHPGSGGGGQPQYGQGPTYGGGQQPSFMDTAPQPGNSSYYQVLPYTSSAPAQGPPPAENPWQMHQAPDGRPFWHNTQTNVTQWEQP